MAPTRPYGTAEEADSPEARFAALERKLDLAELHRTVAVAANEARTVEEAMEIALGEICSLDDWPVGHGYLRDDEGRFRPTGAWYLESPDAYRTFREVTAGTTFEPGEGLIGRVGARGVAEWVRDVSEDPAFVRGRKAPVEVKGALVVPVFRGSDVLGVLEFFADRALEPDPALLEVLTDVGRQLGIVVERSRAERAQRISEEKFSGIVSISAEAILSVDAEERIIHFNEGARDVFGYEAEEVLGEPLEMLIPERFRRPHREHVAEFGASEVQARRMGERQKVYGLRKSGQEFPAEASISKLDVEGETIFSVVLRDISEQRRYEEALRHHARELKRSNQELEQFAFVASHDLQEPLRKIRSFGERLRTRYGDELDETGRDYIERMHSAADRMSALIQDLLAFSRVTTRANPFEPADLGAVAREAVSDLEEQIRETGGEVDVEDLPVVEADRTQMRQLFQNLVSNGLKYHQEGVPPRVEISGRIVEAPAPSGGSGRLPRAEIEVRDNGIGFDEKYAERIFGVFERLHGRSAYEGTGIGLAICRKIVERHGGTLTAAAAPGEGAIFTITLPLEAAVP